MEEVEEEKVEVEEYENAEEKTETRKYADEYQMDQLIFSSINNVTDL